jgi:heat shock protein HslJ
MKRVQLLGTVLLIAATVLAACAPSGGGAAGKTVYVGPYQVPCTGVAPQMCMLVREDPDKDWTMFYDQIQGFDYEPGYEYELRVQEEKLENPPADASSVRWVLVEVVSKERSLEGTTWVLESFVNAGGQVITPLPDTEVTALFAGGQLGGNASCNTYTGQYSASSGKISIGVGAMTMMYCGPEEVMEQEQQYVAALGNAAAYDVQEESLRIANSAGQTILQYRLQETTPLVGTDWEVLWYNNGTGGYTSVLLGTEITALFGEDGSLTGTAGCNSYSTSFELGGGGSAAQGSISFGPAVTTRMFCAEPEGTMDQESAYLKALESATTYEIKGQELEFKDSEGTRMVTFAVRGASTTGLDEASLKNMAYTSEWGESGTVQLTDGEYRAPAAPGSASEIVVQVIDPISYGELNGQPVAAVVLASSGGGTGTFMDLAVVMEKGGQPVHVATAPLGDRSQIGAVRIENNEIVVEMITHGPDDAMCCPTQQVVQSYALEGEQLVLTSSGSPSLTGVVWQWTSFTDPLSKTTVDDPTLYTVEFRTDGSVSAKADCNQGNGTYTAEGGGSAPSGSIDIEIMAMTMAMCPPGSLSDQFVQYLNEAAIYFYDGENLGLDLPADSGTMLFSPAK